MQLAWNSEQQIKKELLENHPHLLVNSERDTDNSLPHDPAPLIHNPKSKTSPMSTELSFLRCFNLPSALNECSKKREAGIRLHLTKKKIRRIKPAIITVTYCSIDNSQHGDNSDQISDKKLKPNSEVKSATVGECWQQKS
uniref:Uncharacterized protein n=1 Tax=Romanomermis culicivorax TaxID=13658 RepID=A0A915KTN6_ROMCU